MKRPSLTRIAANLCLIALCLIAAPASRLHAESWRTTKTVCQDWAKNKRAYHNFEECVLDIFTLDPVGPTGGSIGSGSGIAAGLRAVKPFNKGRLESNLTARGMYSINNFYLLDLTYTMIMPPVGHWKTTGKNTTKFVDDDMSQIKIAGSKTDLRTQDFYGLGPNSTLAGHAVYRLQEDSVGADAYTLLTSWSGVNAGIHYLSPEVKGVSGDSLPSVGTFYGEHNAPASIARPDFVEIGVGASLRTPTFKVRLPWESHTATLLYQHYSDVGSSRYSFGQLSAAAALTAQLRPRMARFEYPRPWGKDLICQQGNDLHCTLGTLTVSGLTTVSYTGANSQVPFYLQPTLGGTDVNGVDTLRGLVDYRLRAPNRVLVQTQFDKAVWGPLGLYTFFDAGQVEPTPSQLSFSNLRTDVGVGATLSVQNKIVVRLYIGFGAGEGSHPNVKIPSAF